MAEHAGDYCRPVSGLASRREVLRAAAFGSAVLLAPLDIIGQAADGTLPDVVEFRRLVAANRILAHENVVDAFGHVSVRDPRNPERYVMARSRSPELVEHADLMEFALDGTPIDARGRTAYGERMIHGAIYEARADVHAVVHNHSYAVLPFTITSEPLRPVIHTAAVIGTQVPVWDIRDDFGDTDLLVRRMDQGRSLARSLGKSSCALMRGHGAVVAARSVQEAVMTAVYLQVNADVQARALSLGTLKPLRPAEVAAAAETQLSPLALDRAWEYFCTRAGIEPI
jgi:ribulose-5-phosphate 4-epimerase/fuculose-1-phosphate aldolase